MTTPAQTAKGMEFDAGPEGCAPTVRSAATAAHLATLTVWPRMVRLVDGYDPVRVERVWIDGRDPEGVARVKLGTHAGALATLFGLDEFAILGPVPLVRPKPHNVGGSMLIVAENVAVPEPRAGRRVLMLGGPLDGEWRDTTALEIDTVGAYDDDGWRVPTNPGDELRQVFYRVRPASEVALYQEWAERARGSEWVATFEGVRAVDLRQFDGWLDLGCTAEPGPVGAERDALLAVLEEAVLGVGGYAPQRIAAACLDAILADPIRGQCGGEADPDEVLVDVVSALEGVQRADAGALVEQGLAVLRALEQDYTLHPRPAGRADG